MHNSVCKDYQKFFDGNFSYSTFSIKSIIELITSHPRLTAVSEEISTLFLERFDPSNPLDDARFEAKCKDIVSKIHVLQFDTARVALQKILNGDN